MHRHLRNLSLALLAMIGAACADFGGRGDSGGGYSTEVFITRTKGQVNKHFSAKVTYTSNFISQPQFQVGGTLPPGLSFDPNTGVLEGTPTTAGFWQVTIRVRDTVRGTHDETPGKTRWYYENIELGIYDKLEE